MSILQLNLFKGLFPALSGVPRMGAEGAIRPGRPFERAAKKGKKEKRKKREQKKKKKIWEKHVISFKL